MIQGYSAQDITLLAARIRNILLRLSMLTEAAAALAYDKRDGSGQGHGGSSKPPPETSERRMNEPRQDRPPSRDLSLYDHYAWRFDRAKGDPGKLEHLCTLAELDWRERRVQKPPPEDEVDRNRRLIAEYEGIPAIEVAVLERMAVREVKRVRGEFGRETELGEVPGRGGTVTVAQIGELLGVSRQHANDAVVTAEGFPAPVRSEGRVRSWRRADVEVWARARRPRREAA